MPILNSSYHAVKYAELRIGSILKVCRFVIRHITQTETQTETEANFTHRDIRMHGLIGNIYFEMSSISELILAL